MLSVSTPITCESPLRRKGNDAPLTMTDFADGTSTPLWRDFFLVGSLVDVGRSTPDSFPFFNSNHFTKRKSFWFAFKPIRRVNNRQDNIDEFYYSDEVIQLADIIRVFLSVDIDNPVLISKITNVQDALNQDAAKMKLVEKENIHFTWRFFGDTPIETVDAIHEELNKLEYPSFSIEIGGVSAFPKINQPRVIWIGVTKNKEKMLDLKTKTDSLLSVLEYLPEKKFTPHATIARVRAIRNRDLISQNLNSLSNITIGSMIVDSISMTKSTLTPSGAIYDTLWKIKLN